MKEKALKHSNKMLRQDEARSKKVANVQAEWRRGRVNESSTSCCSSSESFEEENQVIKPKLLPNDGGISVAKNISKAMPQDKGKVKMKWTSKPVDDTSVTKLSSAEQSEADEEKEYIYIEVCRRIK